jgi:hypothetical protein
MQMKRITVRTFITHSGMHLKWEKNCSFCKQNETKFVLK